MKNKGKRLVMSHVGETTIDTNDPTVPLQIATYKVTKRILKSPRTLT